tara:strand:+ start:57 stop:425 length:369 start_codon:yes stop_codon:yes gene_type:complete
MKNLITFIFLFISLNAYAVEKKTTFTNEIFKKAQADGKIVIINSWQKTCYTCKKQMKILNQAKKDFNNFLFLSYEQTKYKDIAKLLNIKYWTTIVIYQNNKEIYRSIGETNKEKIYSQLNLL